MTTLSARAILDRAETEADFQAKVIEAAGWLGWKVWHDNDSRKNREGWPDLALWRAPRFMLWELKTERGQPTPEQCEVLEELQQCEGIECYLFRPSDWPQIERLLR